MVNMDGRVCLITGAGNGLGFEYAKSMAALGAHVIINDLGGASDGTGSDTSAAHQAAKKLQAEGWKASANTADVADETQAEAMIAEAFELTGHLDVLVCNAGILRDRMVFNMSPQDWDLVQRVHLRGHFLPLHFAAKRWRATFKSTGEAKPASVVLTSSRSGLYSSAGQINYAAAKAGIASMATVASRELERYGVRVNAIAPMAKTRMTEGSFGEIKATRWGPSNVAPIVTYLASDESADVSGQTFIAGGGRIEWMRTWTPQGAIEAPSEAALTLEDVIAGRDQLFGGRPTTPAAFPTATWD
ncbi:SDR family NAD(P)-dependent oxidoreductase [Leekyejoonella antrihumi]|uniref:SDR family NAD(P)-dependent oxidoreductase n=1 Tax=Leekyejoonella antrihumi TaxID=1660198 RepID=A0A563DXT7_9MICO|nr:SDR family NAD(P)-dependent oxidoreductase [Leekyejoonella antrihumi]TWP34939.1 SDR family NAD(P)-dependent oxidoreductase [Leekyejoonella antrihumi]